MRKLLAAIVRWARRLLKRISNTPDTEPEPEPEPDPPDEPEPEPEPDPPEEPETTPEPEPEPEPDPDLPDHDCAEAEWNEDADNEIEVGVHWPGDNRAAAEVARTYLEYALADAFGDGYRIDVFVGEQVPAEKVKTLEGQGEAVRNLDRTASDMNHFIGAFAPDGGGGSTSSGGDPGPIAELHPECVERVAGGEGHYEVNMVLHEVGHSLGMSHKRGGKYGGYGDAWVVPMATSYINSTPYQHEYHEDSIKEADY